MRIGNPSSHGSCATSAVFFTNNRSYVTGANVPPFDTCLSSQYNGDNSQFDLWVFVPLLPVTLPPHLVYAIAPLVVETDIYTDIGSTTDYIFPHLPTTPFFKHFHSPQRWRPQRRRLLQSSGRLAVGDSSWGEIPTRRVGADLGMGDGRRVSCCRCGMGL